MTPATTSYPLPEPNTTRPSRLRLVALMREINAYVQSVAGKEDESNTTSGRVVSECGAPMRACGDGAGHADSLASEARTGRGAASASGRQARGDATNQIPAQVALETDAQETLGTTEFLEVSA